MNIMGLYMGGELLPRQYLYNGLYNHIIFRVPILMGPMTKDLYLSTGFGIKYPSYRTRHFTSNIIFVLQKYNLLISTVNHNTLYYFSMTQIDILGSPMPPNLTKIANKTHWRVFNCAIIENPRGKAHRSERTAHFY